MKHIKVIAIIAIIVIAGSAILAGQVFGQNNENVLTRIPCEITVQPGYQVLIYGQQDSQIPVSGMHFGNVKRGMDDTNSTFWIANEGSETVKVKPRISGELCLTATFDPSSALISPGERVEVHMNVSYGKECPIGDVEYFIEIVQQASP